jgi:hypothetical protein
MTIAHTVKTSGDVAATFHLEPSHNPKAGEPSQAWFALTKVGGELIPLSDCDCQLAVKLDEKVIATVPLKAIKAEQYQGIPGGEIIFPKVGIYELAFSGKAKDGKSFQPLELEYEVTVQPGNAVATPIPTTAPTGETTPTHQVEQSSKPPRHVTPTVLALIIGAVGLSGIVFWRRRDR